MERDLKPKEVMLLKKLEEDQWKSSSELWDDKKIQNKMSRRWMNDLYGGMTGDNPGLVDCKGQRPKHYRLNQKGKEALQRNDPKLKDYEDGIEYGEKVRLFEEFFEENEDLAVDIAQNEVATLDWEKLDKFNFELADELAHNYESTMDALKEAIKGSTHISDDSKVETAYIKIENYNYSTEKEEDAIPVSQLRSRDLGELVKVEGQVDTVGQIQPEIVSAIFECSQCGDRYEKEQTDTQIKSPYKCECGSRKFEIDERRMQDSMVFRMKTKTAEGGKGELRAVVRGAALEDLHTLQKNAGKNIKATGHLSEMPEGKDSRRYKFLLEVNNIEYSGDNWELEPLTSQKKQELEQLKEEYFWDEWLDSLCSSFAPHILHRKPVKLSALFLLLGRNDTEPETDNLNELIVGDPGVGKSDVFEWAEKEMPKIRMGDGQASTGVGLTATTVKDEITGDWQAQAGLMPKMHNGFVAIDEFDKMDDDDYDDLHSILESQKFRLNKANIDQEVPADVGVVALANPKLGSFDPYEPKITQIPIPGQKDAILNRFAFVLFVEGGFDDKEKNQEVNDAVLIQGEPEERLEEDEVKKVQPEFEVETMRDIIQYAQSFEPFSPRDVRKEISNFHIEHSGKLNDSNGGDTRTVSNKRQLRGMKQVARAFARMDFSDTVEMKHTEEMKSFYKVLGKRAAPENYEADKLTAFIDQIPQSRESHRKNKRHLFKKMIKQLSGDEEPVEVEEVVSLMTDEIDESEEYVEKVLDSMNSEGEIFEPKSGHIQLT